MLSRSLFAMLAIAGSSTSSFGHLTINLTFIPGGTRFSTFTGAETADAGSQSPQTLPASVAGDYSVMNAALQTAMTCAAGWWSSAIRDDYTLNINYGWSIAGVIGANPNAIADTRVNGITRSITATNRSRPKDAVVRFSANAATHWFIDDTPPATKAAFVAGDAEYRVPVEADGDIRTDSNAGSAAYVNIVRRSQAIPGSAAHLRLDLFDTALHEIGHALGLDTTTYAIPVSSRIELSGARSLFPDATSIPVTHGGINGLHLSYVNVALAATGDVSERRMLTAADILAVGEQGDWRQLNLDPQGHIPAPPAGSAALIAGWLVSRRRVRA